MRINFRAWLKDDKKMVEVSKIHFDNKMIETAIIREIKNKIVKTTKIFNFSEIILMQSTGLKDKNGKDIYEDDIVNAFDGDNYYVNCCIGYNKGVFYLYKPYHPHFYVLFNKLQEIEVIGNIYENKELVENE